MKEICKNIQDKILSADKVFIPEVNRHINQCQECKMFADEWITIRDLTDEIEVPRSLDFNIMDIARENIDKRAKRKPFSYRIISLAASLVFVSWLCYMTFSMENIQLDEKTGLIYKTVNHTLIIESVNNANIIAESNESLFEDFLEAVENVQNDIDVEVVEVWKEIPTEEYFLETELTINEEEIVREDDGVNKYELIIPELLI